MLRIAPWIGALLILLAPSVGHSRPLVSSQSCSLFKTDNSVASDTYQTIEQLTLKHDANLTPLAKLNKVHISGPDKSRFVLVLFSEGFSEQALARGEFDARVNEVIGNMRSSAPWSNLLTVTNVYSISIASSDDGITRPSHGVFKSTYFGASYGSGALERLITISGPGQDRMFALADALIGSSKWSSAAIIANDPGYGGAGGAMYAISALDQLPQVMMHELGHSIFGLADEYGGDEESVNIQTSTFPNIDNVLPPKWHAWIDTSTEMPTQPVIEISANEHALNSEVGAYEGGLGHDHGVFHPATSCMMNNLSGFCPICKEAMITTFFKELPLVDKVNKRAGSVVRVTRKVQKIKVSLSPLPNLTLEWNYCGRRLKQQAGSQSVNVVPHAKGCTLVASILYAGNDVRQITLRKRLKWKIVKLR